LLVGRRLPHGAASCPCSGLHRGLHSSPTRRSSDLNIDARGSGTLRRRIIVRINSARAREEARIRLEDSRLNKLVRARGALYDRSGKLVDSLTTLSAFFKICGFGPQFTLYTDICSFNGEVEEV